MHIPVMLKETIDRLNVRKGGVYIDATLGDGGHSAEILRRVGGDCRLLAIDRDECALERTSKRLSALGGEITFVHGNHADLGALADGAGFAKFDGLLIDSGVSSEQLDEAWRGFSFSHDGPLDMRMDRSRGETAAELLARLDEKEMANLFRRLGEEPRAGRVARAICREREQTPIETTARLAAIITTAAPHPTRVFQALRMAVNREMESLEDAINAGIERLASGGRVAVITFESLTDRLVKQTFAAHVAREVALQEGGSRLEFLPPMMRLVDKKPVIPSAEEIAANSRSRSAKLRTAEKCAL